MPHFSALLTFVWVEQGAHPAPDPRWGCLGPSAKEGQGAQTDYMGLALLLALMLAVGIYLWKSGLTARMKNPDDPLFVRASAYSATIMSLFFLLIYLWSDLATETRFIGTSMVIMLPFFFYLTGEALMRGLKQQDDRTQERIQALEAALAELKEKPAV